MCDYSLEMYRSVPARAGEEYRSHRFQSGTIGFVSQSDPAVAVCMACDSRLRLTGLPENVCRSYGLKPEEVAIFTRLDGHGHRDAVEFANGNVVNLQHLGAGVMAYVEDTLTGLPAKPARQGAKSTAELAD